MSNNIGVEGGTVLAEVIMMPSVSLDTLIIGDGASLRIGAIKRGEPTDWEFRGGPAEAIILARALKVYTGSLNTLNLYGNWIGPEGAKAIANWLQVFTGSLNTLDLGCEHPYFWSF
eukprot:440002-Prorocentrum_minimum.AAC.1